MRIVGHALFAAAGVIALSGAAFAAEKTVPAFVVSQQLALDAARAPAPLQFDMLNPAAVSGLFNSSSLGLKSDFGKAGNAPVWSVGNDIKFRVDLALGAPAPDLFSFSKAFVAGNPFSYQSGSASAFTTTLNWDFADWGGANITAMNAQDASPILGRASNKSLGVSAYLGLGEGWVGSISYSENQLAVKTDLAAPLDLGRSAYSVAIAKHGLFGDDTLGLLLSRPAVAQNPASVLSGLGASSIPSLYVHDRLLSIPADADIELGYVTSFLGGTVALQTNASYGMNFDKKPDTISLLSRAKIKF